MYQISDIAKHLQLPESTVRTWRDQFSLFVPGTGEGRARRFSEEEFQLFLEIAHHKQQRLTVPEITDRLTKRHALTMPDESHPEESLAQNLPQIIYRMAEHIATLQTRLDQMEAAQREGLSQVSDELASTRETLLQEIQKRDSQHEQVIKERDDKVLQQLEAWREETRTARVERKGWWPFSRH